ncbi:MAG TPA: peroxiredoxin [Ktedonobacterales bacterium]|jgi:peroxiredoxin Q/BCP
MSEQPLQVGDLAPDFSLPNEAGEQMKLSSLRGQRVVLYFYPMDDTPGCTLQACSFRDSFHEIQERNAVVLGISPDNEASHQTFKSKYDLPFTLLVDADHSVSKTYGCWQEDVGYIKRSQFIIDEQGKLVDVQVPVKAKESLQLALEALG